MITTAVLAGGNSKLGWVEQTHKAYAGTLYSGYRFTFFVLFVIVYGLCVCVCVCNIEDLWKHSWKKRLQPFNKAILIMLQYISFEQ